MRTVKKSMMGRCLWTVSGGCLLSGAVALGADLRPAPTPVQSTTQTEVAPTGWFLAGSTPANYRTDVDSAMSHERQASAYLMSAPAKAEGFGTLMQSIQAKNYAGKRVRLRALVEAHKVGQWAGLWMRVDKDRTTVAFDNMQDRAIKGTQMWRSYEVVLDVPEDATGISFGVLLTGAGKVWTSGVTFEVVGREIAVTAATPRCQLIPSLTPVNLDFRQ